MEDGKISEFLEMQRILAETKGWSDQFTPEHAPMSLLWSIEEIGEAVAVIKKKGGDAIMQNESVRAHFIEECADIFMYLFDVFLSYGITSEEFYAAYRGKFQRNMGRDWRENNALYEDCRWKLVIFDDTVSVEEALTEFLEKIDVKVACGGNFAEIAERAGVAPSLTVVCVGTEAAAAEAARLGMTPLTVSHTPLERARLQSFLFAE